MSEVIVEIDKEFIQKITTNDFLLVGSKKEATSFNIDHQEHDLCHAISSVTYGTEAKCVKLIFI